MTIRAAMGADRGDRPDGIQSRAAGGDATVAGGKKNAGSATNVCYSPGHHPPRTGHSCLFRPALRRKTFFGRATWLKIETDQPHRRGL